MNMFSKEDIDELLRICESGENYIDSPHIDSPLLRVVEAKVQIERWDLCVTNYIFHTSMEGFVSQSLKGKITASTGQIWGADISYSDFCPVDIGIAVDMNVYSDQIENGRHVAVFPV
jgi:hypothetical protein